MNGKMTILACGENLTSQEIIGGADEPTSIYLESSSDSDSSETE